MGEGTDVGAQISGLAESVGGFMASGVCISYYLVMICVSGG